MRKCLILSALSLGLAGLTPNARATSIASDNFESYVSGSAAGSLNGGAGFSAGYTTDTTAGGVNIGAESLSYTYSGGGFSLSGGNQDMQVGKTSLNGAPSGIDNATLDRQFAVQTTNPIYFGFLLHASAGATSNNEFLQVGLSSATGVPNQSIVVSGSTASAFDFSLRSGATTTTSSLPFAAGTTYFVVGEISVSGSNGVNYDTINLYINPGATQPGTPSLTSSGNGGGGSVNYFDVRTARFTAGDIFSLDNVSIGTTYGDVLVSVPEPATGGLLLVGAGLGLCARYRRQRAAWWRRMSV